jgi:chromate transporter
VKALSEILRYFLGLGFLGFGGPVAMVAMMQKDLVEDRQWISAEEFEQAISLIKALPGSLAFQTAVYIGMKRAGRLAGLVAGVSMIAPAFVIVIFLSQVLDRLNGFVSFQMAMMGLQAAAIGVIIASLHSLAKSYLKITKFWIFFGVACFLMLRYPHGEPLFIISAGLLSILMSYLSSPKSPMLNGLVVFPIYLISDIISIEDFEKLKELSWVCLKAGAIVFGTGLAIVPVLEDDFVTRLHWLSHSEFMSALAIGQVTPGPVLITTTFIGYKVVGLLGAFTATVAIYLPSAMHILTWFSYALNYVSKQKWIKDFLIGTIATVVGSVLVTSLKLSSEFKLDYFFIFVILLAVVLSLSKKLPTWAVIFMGGGLGIGRFYLSLLF